MIIIGETFHFRIGVNGVLQNIGSLINLDEAGQNVFDCVVRNVGQAPLTVNMYYSATAGGTYSAMTDRDGNTSTITLQPGGQGYLSGVAEASTGYVKMMASADLTKITLPTPDGVGYIPGGSVVPNAEGKVKFVANDTRPALDSCQ